MANLVNNANVSVDSRLYEVIYSLQVMKIRRKFNLFLVTCN